MFKLLFVGFMFFITISQTFSIDLCQNSLNGFFSMINQIEPYLTFRRLTGDISY